MSEDDFDPVTHMPLVRRSGRARAQTDDAMPIKRLRVDCGAADKENGTQTNLVRAVCIRACVQGYALRLLMSWPLYT